MESIAVSCHRPFVQLCLNFLLQILCSIEELSQQPTMAPSRAHLKMQCWSWFSLKNLQWLPLLLGINSKLINMRYTFPVWDLPYLLPLLQPQSMLQPHWGTYSMSPVLGKYLMLLLASSYLSYLCSPTITPVCQSCFFHLRVNTLSYSLRNLFLNRLPSKPGALSTLLSNLYTDLLEHSSNLIVVVYLLVWFFSVMLKWDHHC